MLNGLGIVNAGYIDIILILILALIVFLMIIDYQTYIPVVLSFLVDVGSSFSRYLLPAVIGPYSRGIPRS